MNKLVFKWRLPSYNNEDEQILDNATANYYPQCYGYYVEGMPVRITYNLSLKAKIENGTLGHTSALCPQDPKALIERIKKCNYKAGDIIEISTPIAVIIKSPTVIK